MASDTGNMAPKRRTQSGGPASQVPNGMKFAPTRRRPVAETVDGDDGKESVEEIVLTEHHGSSDSEDSSSTSVKAIEVHLTQKHNNPDDESISGGEVEVDCAMGSTACVHAMMSGKPMTAIDRLEADFQNGIKTEAQCEMQHKRLASQGSQQSNAPVPVAPVPVAPVPVAPVPVAPVLASIPLQRQQQAKSRQSTVVASKLHTQVARISNPCNKKKKLSPILKIGAPVARDPSKPLSEAAKIRIQMEDMNDFDTAANNAEVSCKRGGNTSDYENRKENREKQFFSAILTHGGKSMAFLLKIEPSNYSNGTINDYHFCNAIGGPKDADKHWVLNKALVLCALKWVVTAGALEKQGKPLQPSMFKQCLKLLFMVFTKKGILYSFDLDFNDKGQFHGVLINIWNKAINQDPSFGCQPNESEFMDDADKRFFKALTSGVFDLNKAIDLVQVIIYILGRFCAFRGISEQHQLKVEHAFLGRCADEQGVNSDIRGRKCVGVWIPWLKGMTVSLKKVVGNNQQMALQTVVEDPRLGEFDPYSIMARHMSEMHPESVRFLCKPCNSADHLQECQDAHPGKDIRFYPSKPTVSNYVFGKQKIAALQKDVAKRCGAPNWEKCTGHGLRKLCVTIAVNAGLHPIDVAKIARHGSLHSQKSYAKDAMKRKGMRAAVLQMNVEEEKKPAAVPQKKQKKTVQFDAGDSRLNIPPTAFMQSSFLAQHVPSAIPNVSIPQPQQQSVAEATGNLSAEESQMLKLLLKRSGMKTPSVAQPQVMQAQVPIMQAQAPAQVFQTPLMTPGQAIQPSVMPMQSQMLHHLSIGYCRPVQPPMMSHQPQQTFATQQQPMCGCPQQHQPQVVCSFPIVPGQNGNQQVQGNNDQFGNL